MTDSPVHLGLDVAKLTLAVCLRGRSFELPNTPAGWRRLLRRLHSTASGVHVVCEASGGYERGVVAFLQQAQVPVIVLNAQRVRELARGCGQLAKTDQIDAAMLARIGAMLAPAAQPLPENGRAELVELVARRDALVSLRKLEKQHAEHLTLPVSVRSQRRTLAFWKRRSPASKPPSSPTSPSIPTWKPKSGGSRKRPASARSAPWL